MKMILGRNAEFWRRKGELRVLKMDARKDDAKDTELWPSKIPWDVGYLLYCRKVWFITLLI